MDDTPNAVNKIPPADITLSANTTTSPARSLGPYRLLQELGQGGMGEVWLAEQTTPIRRTVALKLIKAGMDTNAVVARFESERQALALMDHANIAKVFEAGSTPDGRPFFVMEYVPGIPITDYCDKHRLSVRERLALFTQVCEGVQHAHQKAIIHRDLKPSNVLVVLQDDKAVPKIIDFGLAKATAQRLTERTMFTELGAMVGTPGYMSPEQADITEHGIDTRTDVYSLGVILYELLVGALPHDAKELREAGFEGMLRTIRDEDPPRPSTKILALGDASKISAENRKEEPQTLARHLRGDLDWITMKALEKDKTRRYGSPSDLARDIDRHLRNEPVLACPPSTAYRTKKFVRRHRSGVLVSTAAVLLLLGFAITMAAQARRIARERDRANLEAETSRRVTEFMTGMFTIADPSEAKGNSITAREILDKASKEIDPGLEKDPLLQARMLDTMGNVYGALGLYLQSKPLLTKALDIRLRILGPQHPDTLLTMRHLAATLGDNGEFAEAEKINRQLLAIQKRVLASKDPERIKTMNNLAAALRGLGRYEEAELLLRQTVDDARKELGPDHPLTLNIASHLSEILTEEKKYAEAEKLGRETLAIARQAPEPDRVATCLILTNLAFTLGSENQFADGAAITREALELSRQLYGPESARTLLLRNNLGYFELHAGQLTEAEQEFRETLDIERRVLGPANPYTAETKENLAALAALRGERDTALSWLRDAVDHGLPPFSAKDIESDEEYKSLHADPRFIAIVADVHKRYGTPPPKP